MRCFFTSLIDGTVAGTDIRDIPGYQDANAYHDHSFYGNGCLQEDVQGGVSYSYETCSTRVIGTYMNAEYQDIGVYYNYQATSAGSGASLNTDNANIPDTFCPLGWQIPYGGTGGDYYDKSRSWRFLFNKYNALTTDKKLGSYPLDFVLSSHYGWHAGLLFVLNGALFYTGTVNATNGAYWFVSWSFNAPGFQNDSITKSDGYPIRCASVLYFSSTARWREHLQI